jgi:hypothetical protein
MNMGSDPGVNAFSLIRRLNCLDQMKLTVRRCATAGLF